MGQRTWVSDTDACILEADSQDVFREMATALGVP
jgi:hypothetical protein